ncbi:sigma factor-like helix-turn-helix DNA-binding protein, partial [Streptomyces echinoruber]
EIGRRLNVSQMHISRLISRILTRLRCGLLAAG